MKRVAVQLAAAVCLLVGGAWLVGLWMVGIVLMLIGLGVVADLVLRDSDRWERPTGHTHEDVIERWRRAS